MKTKTQLALVLGLASCSLVGCGPSLEALDSVNQTDRSPIPVSQDLVSESSLMRNLFRATSNVASASGQCQFLGDASLPLVTNYPSLGDKETPGFINTLFPQQFLNGQSNVPYYNVPNFLLPVVTKYIGGRYAVSSYPPDQERNQDLFNQRLNQLCVGGLTKVRFVQGPYEIKVAGDISRLVQQNVPYFQILHALVYRENLFTLVIPPYWSPTTSASLPTLFNGFYDLNQNFMELEGPSLLGALANAYRSMNKTGFGIFWNGHGAEGSRSVDTNAYRELNDFLGLYLGDLGASSAKFVSFGASRGGVTALNFASHPALTNVRVVFTYASVAPNELDTVVHLTSTTVPALLGASDWSVGIVGSWRKSFRHPTGFNRQSFEGLSGAESHLKVLTGSSSESDMRSEFNALAPAKVEKLRRNGTQIFYEASSHDLIAPSTDQLKTLKDAVDLGLNVEGRINYLIGHSHDNGARQEKLNNVIETLVASAGTTPTFVTKGRISRYIASPDGKFEPVAGNQPRLAVELPRFIIDEVDTLFLVSGKPNLNYLLVFRHVDHPDDIVRVRGRLNEYGLENRLVSPETFRDGDYSLLGAYMLDADGRPTGKVQMLSLTNGAILVTRYSDDLKPYVANVTGNVIEGIRARGSYFNANTIHGSNYGFIESGVTAIGADELNLIREPARFSCMVTGNSIASFSMAASITPETWDRGKSGHYFVGGYDGAKDTWYIYDGAKWEALAPEAASVGSVSGPSAVRLSSSGYSAALFDAADLRGFEGAQIFLGYGVGNSLEESWADLKNRALYQECVTLPR